MKKIHALHSGKRRVVRVSARTRATAERSKLLVFRSNKHIFAQVIDFSGKVLASATDLGSSFTGTKIERARQVGELVAARAQKNGVKSIIFDRHGYAYHGRIQALAEAAREGGLQF